MAQNAVFQPLTATLGAEANGIDLIDVIQENDDSKAGMLCDALTRHKVLIFRSQHPSPDMHIAAGKKLGALAPKHPLYPKVEGYEDIIRIVNDDDNPPENEVWHADVTFDANPSFAAVLHGVEIPEVGGDTLFADMGAIARDLSSSFKRFLRGLTAFHSLEQGFKFVHDRQADARSSALANTEKQAFSATHPVLRPHPITGEEILYVNASFTEYIHELAPAESQHLLDYLFGLVKNPRYQLRVKWQKGTVLMWDNWATQHFACGDHYPRHREVQRVTVQHPSLSPIVS